MGWNSLLDDKLTQRGRLLVAAQDCKVVFLSFFGIRIKAINHGFETLEQMAAFFTSDLVIGCWALKECALARVDEVIKTESTLAHVVVLWGVIQVLSILLNAIKRLKDRAILPLKQKDLNKAQWTLYVCSILGMIYKEGYEAFQLKWAPLVVKRAFMLTTPGHPLTLSNMLFTGPYAMGMFGATTKRMIVSWSVTIGVTSLVQVVKKMPYPYRNIVDAGVVAGLTYGCCALVFVTAQTMQSGVLPSVDPCYEDSDALAAAGNAEL